MGLAYKASGDLERVVEPKHAASKGGETGFLKHANDQLKQLVQDTAEWSLPEDVRQLVDKHVTGIKGDLERIEHKGRAEGEAAQKGNEDAARPHQAAAR